MRHNGPMKMLVPLTGEKVEDKHPFKFVLFKDISQGGHGGTRAAYASLYARCMSLFPQGRCACIELAQKLPKVFSNSSRLALALYTVTKIHPRQ